MAVLLSAALNAQTHLSKMDPDWLSMFSVYLGLFFLGEIKMNLQNIKILPHF